MSAPRSGICIPPLIGRIEVVPVPGYDILAIALSGSMAAIGSTVCGIYRWHVRRHLGERLIEKCRREDAAEFARAVFGNRAHVSLERIVRTPSAPSPGPAEFPKPRSVRGSSRPA
jgi:hypothetical protein